ncbi:hypothetical protein [Carnobacterium funditum]|nr:hypothetical protein [Carnobacterium funditum]
MKLYFSRDRFYLIDELLISTAAEINTVEEQLKDKWNNRAEGG